MGSGGGRATGTAANGGRRRRKLERTNSIPDFVPKPKALPPPPGAGTKDIVSVPPSPAAVVGCLSLRAGVPFGDMAGNRQHTLRIGGRFAGYLMRLERHVRTPAVCVLELVCLRASAPVGARVPRVSWAPADDSFAHRCRVPACRVGGLIGTGTAAGWW